VRRVWRPPDNRTRARSDGGLALAVHSLSVTASPKSCIDRRWFRPNHDIEGSAVKRADTIAAGSGRTTRVSFGR